MTPSTGLRQVPVFRAKFRAYFHIFSRFRGLGWFKEGDLLTKGSGSVLPGKGAREGWRHVGPFAK